MKYAGKGDLSVANLLTVLFLTFSVAAFLVGCPPPNPIPRPEPEPSTLSPGLEVLIKQVRIPADLRPEVIFQLRDGSGNLIPKAELTDARFILAYLSESSAGAREQFVSYTTRIEDPDGRPGSGDEAVQATYDNAQLAGIRWNGDGTYTYKFETPLPPTFNRSLTHQLGGQFQRRYPVDGQVYKYNAIYRFRPDGGTVAQTREIVSTQACNNCHTRLSEHGDARRDVQLCILCHSPQSTDANTGNTVDFAVLIHKIHMGEELPSVQAGQPYQIIGRSVHDYSTVAFPQDIRNCTVCHQDAPQADAYLTTPTRAACGACHDRTWFGNPDETPAGFENHVGGMHEDDSKCTLCHTPTRPGVAPIAEAHLIPTESTAAPGLFLDIDDVQVLTGETGKRVRIVFSARNKDNQPYTDITQISTVAATIAYPAAEYRTAVREQINPSLPTSGTLENLGNGSFAYTFRTAFPDDSQDTFAVAMEGRVSFTFRGETYFQGTATNGLTYFTLDGSSPVLRRKVVDDAKCARCHGEVRAHGSLRVGVEYCIMCHNPQGTDAARRPAEQMPPETIHFKVLIHKIHTGEDLNGPYTVYGFGNVAHDFTDVRFPGDRRECSICHVSGTEQVPLPEEAAPTVIRQGSETVAVFQPTRSACTSCHDSLTAQVHASIMTEPVSGVESCAVCHGPSGNASVARVHARQP